MSSTARFLILWSSPRDVEAFERQYQEVHIPLALTLPGLRRYAVSRQVQPIRGEFQPYLVAELEWDDMAALKRAFESPEGQATAADVAILASYAEVRSMVYEIADVDAEVPAH